MREYLLFSQIPAAREHQVLSILAGVTVAQPVPIYEQVLLYGQLKVPEAAVSKKQSQSKQQKQAPPPSYHKLCRAFSVHESQVSDIKPWEFRAETVPDPGLPTLISRDVTERVATDDDLARLKSPDLYRLKRQYTVHGYRFIYGNVVIRIIRILISGDAALVGPLEHDPPSPSNLKPIDPSGSWIVEAVLRVEDMNLLDQAKKELLDFKALLDGAIDLIAPDRLALDNRVKGQIA